MSFVCVDLGASSSRYVSNPGAINVIPNNMIFLDDMTPSRIVPDTPDIESSLEVQITKAEADKMNNFPANVLIGIMATKQSGINERPNIMEHKHKQRVNYISAIVACAISRLKFDLTEELDLYVAVPPNGVTLAEKAFAECMVGTYTVTFPKYMGGVTVNVKVKNVAVYAESYMAATSFFFNMSGVVRDAAKPYLRGNVLSLDIGASTTDFAVISNGRYLDKSGYTQRIGGNSALGKLIQMISEEYEFEMPFDMAETTMAEGRMQSGNSYTDVSALVTAAKRSLAEQLLQYIPTYFQNVEIPLMSINAIVVSGGGSMQSQYANADGEIIKTTEPLSYFVTEGLVKYSRNTAVVEYGEDARFANVKGLYVRAKVDELKATQKAAAVQTQTQSVQPAIQHAAQAVVKPQVQPQATAQFVQSVTQTVQPQAQPQVQPTSTVQ